MGKGIVLSILLLLGFITPAHARERISTIAGLTVHEWAPAVHVYERAPVVLFSHGLNGCGNQSFALMESLAVKGFWVFAPDHADASCRSESAFSSSKPIAPDDDQRIDRPARWTAETYKSRMDDLVAVLDALRADPDRQLELDFSRIALSGHSLGAYTVLGMAGAWPEWKGSWNSSGVRAVLAFAPYTQPFTKSGDIGNITLPVMYQAGARDTTITTPLTREENNVYDATKAFKYLVVLKDAGHFAWTDKNGVHMDRITRYSTAFLQHYLMGETIPMLTQGGKTLNFFAYESDLGKSEAKSADTGGIISGGDSGSNATLRSGSWRDRESKFGSGSGGVIIKDSRTRKAAEAAETAIETPAEIPEE